MQSPWTRLWAAAAPGKSWRPAWEARRRTSAGRSARTWPATRRTDASASPSTPFRWRKSRAAEAIGRIDRGEASGELSSSWCRGTCGLSAEGRVANHLTRASITSFTHPAICTNKTGSASSKGSPLPRNGRASERRYPAVSRSETN